MAWITDVLFRDWLCKLDNDMRAQKCNIVLLLDNASAHTADSMELKSVTVVFLAPNTSAKLPPMDAGSIASFKRRYRHRQLEHALDVVEQGSQANIYMLEQLTSMKWIKSCWREVPSDAIMNCFRHARLVLGRATTRRSRIDADDQLNNSLLAQMHQLRIRDPMDLNDLICCIVEAETEMEAPTSTALVSDEAGSGFLLTAQESSDFTESESTSEGVINTQPEISAERKVDAVRAIIFLLGDHPDLGRLVMATKSINSAKVVPLGAFEKQFASKYLFGVIGVRLPIPVSGWIWWNIMFKRFSVDENIASHSQIKSSQQRAIRSSILEQYPEIEPYMEQLLPKKAPIILAKCQNHLQLVLHDGVPLFFNYRDGPFMPTLKVLHQLPNVMQMVRADKGAIPFVLSGANVMCPGLTSQGATLPECDVPAGTPVAIMAEGKEMAMAIGILTLSTREIKDRNKGVGIDLMHFVGDELWTCNPIR
uniref:Uncharacterized protein AlNc14C55G4187 n=1 Tax=Albugo laibachii Nc14 TaxID=890382 RepID=F0WC00_9STRA|nr:conserved hypothetical protein [Albugo laibachii Nc14]|eukprot:CCA18681.1 conserved hypothetical protein [Albugo laibachii Nc14]